MDTPVTPSPQHGLRERLARVWSYRRLWVWDLVAVLVLMGGTLLLFALTDLDRIAQRYLFGAVDGERWPLKSMGIWRGLRDYGTLPALFTVVGAMLYLVAAGVKRVAGRYRMHAFFLIIAMAVGPGLVVNQGFKMNWGRPRPDQVREFGGWAEYHAPHQPGVRGTGRSFPCGHCSMGAYFSVFYLLWRRRRPRAAGWALAGTLLSGGLIGVGRMCAGAHFLSDVIWSMLLVFLVNALLYYGVFNLPAWDDARAVPLRMRGRNRGMLIISILLVLGSGAGTLLATAHYRRDAQRLACVPGMPVAVAVEAAYGDVQIAFGKTPELIATFEARGFGFPWSKLISQVSTNDLPSRHGIRFAFEDRGWFSETDARWNLSLPSGIPTHISVVLEQGHVRVDAPPAGTPLPELVVRLERGTVSLDPLWKGRGVEWPQAPVEVTFE